MIKYILLGFLNYQPMTGYELKQTIDHSTSHFWHAYHSQIYTTLRQMEKEGLVTSEFLKEENTPDRRIYTITNAGRLVLTTWLNQTLTEVVPIKEDLLVRMFFSAHREPNEILTELRLQHELHQKKFAQYQEIAAHISEFAQINPPALARDEKFWRLTLDLGIRYEETYLAWLEDSIRTIESL